MTVFSLHCHHQTLLLLLLICLNQYLVSLSYCHYTLVFLLKNVSVCILRYLQFTLTCGTCEFVNRLKCATFLTKFFMVFYLFKFYINTSTYNTLFGQVFYLFKKKVHTNKYIYIALFQNLLHVIVKYVYVLTHAGIICIL